MKAVEYCQEKKKVYCLEGVSNFDAPLFFYRKLCPIKRNLRAVHFVLGENGCTYTTKIANCESQSPENILTIYSWNILSEYSAKF